MKKTTFLFVFSTYLPMFLIKFRAGELIGWEIEFRIQRVYTLHIFDRPCYPKSNIKVDLDTNFRDKLNTYFYEIWSYFGPH